MKQSLTNMKAKKDLNLFKCKTTGYEINFKVDVLLLVNIIENVGASFQTFELNPI